MPNMPIGGAGGSFWLQPLRDATLALPSVRQDVDAQGTKPPVVARVSGLVRKTVCVRYIDEPHAALSDKAALKPKSSTRCTA